MIAMRMLFFSVLLILGGAAADPVAADDDKAMVDKVIKGIEQRYAGKSFKADFFQESILKAMQITDTAEGRILVKPPGNMRWEYTVPDIQTIITDSETMWIHRPADHQVMVGKAPHFFGGGKGAGFLSDIRQIRKSFSIQRQSAENDLYHRLKLVPHQPTQELADIILSVARDSHQIDQVITHNAYGDETRIVFSNYQFNMNLDDALFRFAIPEGTDVVQIDQFQ